MRGVTTAKVVWGNEFTDECVEVQPQGCRIFYKAARSSAEQPNGWCFEHDTTRCHETLSFAARKAIQRAE